MICQPSDVILIPFPFTDLSVAKKRPVLVITPENDQGDFIGLQITSKQGYEKTLEINSEDFILGSLPKQVLSESIKCSH
jgi:mRNA interferase MazF